MKCLVVKRGTAKLNPGLQGKIFLVTGSNRQERQVNVLKW